ncbi:MAG TPA: rRNA maturation RNase YbeY [bacterium]
MNVKIYRLKKSPRISSKAVTRLVRSITGQEGCASSQVNIVLADDAYLRSLNRTFFHKNRPTNVIAFTFDHLVEIYISLDQTRDQADAYYYIAHGLLHVAGHDHLTKSDERRMNRKCLEYIGKVICKRGAR